MEEERRLGIDDGFVAPRAKRAGRLIDYGIQAIVCLLYTSDAADERSSVDLGGRRIIKKKNIESRAAVDDISGKQRLSNAIVARTTKIRRKKEQN